MRSEGRVRVVIRSRKVPIGTMFHTEPVYSASGVLVGSKPSRLVLYGRTLDAGHRRTIEEAEKLASNLGLGLEVVDEARSGLLNRIFSRVGRGRYHSIVLLPQATMDSALQPSVLSQGC